MKISTNNYEEFFLLYADNELSVADKSVVEDFVRQHTELEEELLMFRQSVIKPDDDCVLDDKGFLFKETQKFINHNNYQEVFIMYNDNELNSREREQTETFLLQNSKLSNELMLLQKTKLIPDITVTFPGKQLLYKKKSNGKEVLFKWWRTAAAAIIAAIGLWLAIGYLQTDKEKLPVVFENNPVKKNNKVAPVPVIEKSNEPLKNIVAENNGGKNVLAEKLMLKNGVGNPSKIKETPKVHLVKKQQSIIVPESNINIKNIENEVQSITANEVQQINIDLTKKNDPDIGLTDESKPNDIAITKKDALPDNYALTASYDSDEDENSNNYVFYNITKTEFNRTKLGGFLRKVKRTIERKSPFNNSKDDDEPAVKEHFKKL